MNKRSMTLALLCSAALFGAEASAAPPAVQPVTSGAPVIVDAQNVVVGPAYGQGVVVTVQGVKAYVDLSHTTDFIRYSPTELYWGMFAGQYYPTPDCSGSPFIAVFNGAGANPSPFRPAVVVRNGNTVTLYVAGTSPATTLQANSYGFPGGCGPSSFSTLAYSIGFIVDNLNQLNPEPLRVR